MADVEFVDSETGEVIETSDERDYGVPSRREYRAKDAPVPEKRDRPRTSLWPIALLFVAIAAFMVGGGLGMSMAQTEIHQLKMQLDYPDVP